MSRHRLEIGQRSCLRAGGGLPCHGRAGQLGFDCEGRPLLLCGGRLARRGGRINLSELLDLDGLCFGSRQRRWSPYRPLSYVRTPASSLFPLHHRLLVLPERFQLGHNPVDARLHRSKGCSVDEDGGRGMTSDRGVHGLAFDCRHSRAWRSWTRRFR